MEELPLISVIVPVYNVEAYLDRCVRSIAEQTYGNLEILLVDDGSQDGSGAICDAWAEKDRRVKVIHKQNGGAGEARNVALDVARGELIGLVDSDDFLEEHMYAHLYSLMEDPVDIAECAIGATETDVFPMDDGSTADVRVFSLEDAMRLHIREELFCQTPPNKLYRRSVVGDIRFPVGNLIDDEFWTYRVIGNARYLARSSACMYAYRQRPFSAMHKPYSLRRLQGLYAQQERLEYIRKHLPALEYEAKFELFFCCIYVMQSCLRHLPEPELCSARQIIRGIVAQITPLEANPAAAARTNALLKVAQLSFERTCKFLNFLIDIHILT